MTPSKHKKTEDFRGRLTPKASLKVEEYRIISNNGINQECELLIIDGLAAREYLSQKTIEDNRRKYL